MSARLAERPGRTRLGRLRLVAPWPACLAAALAAATAGSSACTPIRVALFGPNAIEARVAEHGPAARARLAPWFDAAGVAYPPRTVVLAGFKHERRLDVYAFDEARRPRFIRSYPVLGASGGPGPKLVEGDRQVPEGLYSVELLHPDSRYHLALRVSYPNDFDRARAEEEGRADLGGDIMIHGDDVSAGCLAVGDLAIEDLFVLAADVGKENVAVILSPVDFRSTAAPARSESSRPWSPQLYAEIRSALERLPAPTTAR